MRSTCRTCHVLPPLLSRHALNHGEPTPIHLRCRERKMTSFRNADRDVRFGSMADIPSFIRLLRRHGRLAVEEQLASWPWTWPNQRRQCLYGQRTSLVAPHMSAYGQRTSLVAPHMSAFGRKADIRLVQCTCLLLTQSGHWLSHGRPFQCANLSR